MYHLFSVPYRDHRLNVDAGSWMRGGAGFCDDVLRGGDAFHQ
jgi:hypothetical protein